MAKRGGGGELRRRLESERRKAAARIPLLRKRQRFVRRIKAGGGGGGARVDLVADFGAPPGGGDATAAIGQWKAFASTDYSQKTLTIPAGYFTTSDIRWVHGCKGDITILGVASPTPGAIPLTRISGIVFGTGESWAPPPNVGLDANNISLINDVNAGSNSVVLKTPSQALRFVANARVVVTGHCLQGGEDENGNVMGGYPPNPFNFDYCRVVAANPATGVVTLSKNLRFSYRDEWPQADSPPTTTRLYGEMGPAMICILPPDSDQVITMRNVYVSSAPSATPDGGCVGPHRGVVLDNTAWEGRGCSAGMLEFFEHINSPQICGSGQVNEPDKLVGSWTFRNCRSGVAEFQSASIHDVLVDGCVDIGFIGEGRFATFMDCDIPSMQPGQNYGVTEKLEFYNCNIGTSPGGVVTSIPLSDWMPFFSNGTFTRPISNNGSISGYQKWIPGMKYCFAQYTGYPFTVADDSLVHSFTCVAIRSDGTNFIVDIDAMTLTPPTFNGGQAANAFWLFPVQPGPVVLSSVTGDTNFGGWPLVPPATANALLLEDDTPLLLEDDTMLLLEE